MKKIIIILIMMGTLFSTNTSVTAQIDSVDTTIYLNVDIMEPNYITIRSILTPYLKNLAVTNISVYYSLDIIHISRIKNNMYLIQSEIADFTIGAFSTEDTESLIEWITTYPLNEENARYPNQYYQEIIEEKIWY